MGANRHNQRYFKSADTGEFVSAAYAAANPKTTYKTQFNIPREALDVIRLAKKVCESGTPNTVCNTSMVNARELLELEMALKPFKRMR